MAQMSIAGPRVLLRRLREIMAEPESAQSRLDKTVRIIAANMVAEVCSVYLMRAGSWLELFATEGLNPGAVHQTRLRVGEGLVGEIARTAEPLSLSDAQAHPLFAYRPETGEDPYRSLMGVPILRYGRVVGVVVVQNQTMRHYTEEEIEALQTVAMVLAEMVAAEELVDPAELHEAELEDRLPRRLDGLPLASGIAIGRAVLHEPRVEVTRLIAEDLEEERRRLEEAVAAVRAAVDRMLHSPAFSLGGEHREILEAYRMFANDHGWLMRMREAIASGLTAEAAVERVQVETRARLMRATDPYLRERLHDLEDLANRLLRQLAGKARTAAYEQLGEDAIVVARNMGPAELLDYDPAKLRGIVLEEGSATSHVAIVARALDLPLVGGLDGILEWIEPDDPLVVDGDSGDVYLRPSSDILQAYQEKIALRAQQQAQFAALRELPSVTRDGVVVDLAINAGLLLELPHLKESGACGIGLFRTELQFMISATFPRLTAQTALYRQVLDAAEPRPVVFRTLDIGGDKVLPYLATMREQNPALGWRAIRIALDRPVLLRYQIRALLAAAAGRDLNVMFPLVAEIEEFIEARALVEREIERLRRFGRPLPRQIRVGTMLEVPALAWRIKVLLPHIDFVSVGSNDLLQFFFACDRENPRLAGRYDLLSPSLLSLLHHVVRACQAAGVPVSICGEQAGRPLEAMALVGIGFRTISMPSAAVGPVKRMIRSLSVTEIEAYIGSLLDLPDRSLRPRLEAFAREKGIFV